MVETLDNKRKKLIFRSWHRGTREMDLIMGRFADANMADFSDVEVDQYEELLNVPDPDIYEWICRRTDVPANLRSGVIDKLLAHHPYQNVSGERISGETE